MEKDVIEIKREQLEALVAAGLKVVVNWSLISECNDDEVGAFLVARFEENIKRLAKAAGSVHDSMQELNDL
nr:MAG TPA: hypothetical protein [Caudoviricetes sp.]